MATDNHSDPDPNANASETAGGSTGAAGMVDIDAAWLEWSSHFRAVDERGLTLLRAGFEAGYDAGRKAASQG